ncbi:DNA repair protein RadC [Suttonella sp. R2A3]|uniref:RadC family protein n=1 Tax=Suttonella sp. R2A3 TaxID=2908648 RepID=UPI001F2859CC|nr:DNA repair protein RadC [Suttonella sp. R2A3]UJF23739.1 DNA repair protein RadC [Suttonella sp. R2A3]
MTKAQIHTDMPRERLLRLGAAALADYELLALLLRTGTREHDVLSFARTILNERNGLVGLLNSDQDDLAVIKGLGQAKIAELLAVMEIARRYANAEVSHSQWTFTSPQDVRDFLMLQYKGLQEERLGILLLNQGHRLLSFAHLANGSVAAVDVPIREILRRVLQSHAAAVIMVHNHPAQSLEPSASDQAVTRRIEESLTMIDVRLLDHFIVAGNTLVSMREQGGW